MEAKMERQEMIEILEAIARDPDVNATAAAPRSGRCTGYSR